MHVSSESMGRTHRVKIWSKRCRKRPRPIGSEFEQVGAPAATLFTVRKLSESRIDKNAFREGLLVVVNVLMNGLMAWKA